MNDSTPETELLAKYEADLRAAAERTEAIRRWLDCQTCGTGENMLVHMVRTEKGYHEFVPASGAAPSARTITHEVLTQYDPLLGRYDTPIQVETQITPVPSTPVDVWGPDFVVRYERIQMRHGWKVIAHYPDGDSDSNDGATLGHAMRAVAGRVADAWAETDKGS